MATKNEYNGWFNYETWNLALWLGNDECSQNQWQEVTREAFSNATGTDLDGRKQNACIAIAILLESQTKENSPEVGNNFYSDILNAAISEVNWYEIAKHWLDDEFQNVLDKEEADAAATR